MTTPEDSRAGLPSAVALKYDVERDPAPRVTAKGRGAVAEQILAIAFENGVRVREDADLMAILENLELDSVIPTAVFATVAEILRYVYQANGLVAADPGDISFAMDPAK